ALRASGDAPGDHDRALLLDARGPGALRRTRGALVPAARRAVHDRVRAPPRSVRPRRRLADAARRLAADRRRARVVPPRAWERPPSERPDRRLVAAWETPGVPLRHDTPRPRAHRGRQAEHHVPPG